MAELAVPADQAARTTIRTDLDDTLFVEAGAGSGKTSELVARVVSLVTADPPVPMRHVAAITFTEKAATELRDRLRTDLRELAALDADSAPRCQEALDELDAAAVCTLHAFARRLLGAHPVEAGLPPGVEVLDEVGSITEFEDRWRRFLDILLEDADRQRSLLLTRTAGVTVADLREIAQEFDANWDLVETLPERAAPPPPRLEAGELVRRLVRLSRPPTGISPADRMVQRLAEVADYAARLETAADEADLLWLLAQEKPSLPAKAGTKAAWAGRLDELHALRHDLASWDADRKRLVKDVTDAAVRHVASAIASFTLQAAGERASTGRPTFHDLLVLARRLLADPTHGPTVRRSLRQQYQRILIDEFQDSDPIQIDLAVLLASPDDGAGALPWRDVAVEPGRLFLVGDPKQSIYRFRRADIATFLQARSALADRTVELVQNFRSTAPVIEWVNEVFSRLVVADHDRQPAYLPLVWRRRAAPSGPGVAVVGHVIHSDTPNADELRAREAATVAGAVEQALTQEWTVSDGVAGEESWRSAQPGDIAILLPSRTSLPELERALEALGIPARVDSSSLVYTTREVRDLLTVARAVDDPTDDLAIVTALRSPAFGCGDDDLYTFRVTHGGSWNHQALLPEGLPQQHPVASALRYMRDLHRQRWWMTPSTLLDRIARDRRLFELGVESGRARDVLRRFRFVVDQARAYGDSVGGSLRGYLNWARLQADENARVTEAMLPETDTDAVRISTIHAAKGLEFPICIMSGLTTEPRGSVGRVQVGLSGAGGLELKVGRNLQTRGYEDYRDVEETMSFAERIRLLYVAATRARDHLVVSLHRTDRHEGRSEPARQTGACLLAHAGAGTAAGAVLLDAGADRRRLRWAPRPVATAVRPDFGVWQQEHARLLERGRRRGTVAATTLARLDQQARPDASLTGLHRGDQPLPSPARLDQAAHVPVPQPDEPSASPAGGDPGLAKLDRDLDLPPWARGRYGTAIGRAVHGVLQVVDLVTGADLDAIADAQAASEGVSRHARVVADLARSALQAQVVRQAAGARHWREVYVAAPVGTTLLEGYVDLLFEEPAGLTVVDYKTDAVAGSGDLDRTLARYRLQGAAYALALQLSDGRPVARVVFVYCRAGQPPIERELPDLAAALDEVGERLDLVAAAPPVELELN